MFRNDITLVRKLRGGYYTPPPIADFLAEWAILARDFQVLEPSAGDGAIVTPAARRLGDRGRVTAVELDPAEAEKAAIMGGPRTTIVAGDFFNWFRDTRPDGTFDAVLGNPPFIRYQDFPEAHREPAFALMQEEGLHPSRLTNAWVPFVAVATKALRPGGRLALVLPAELLQVMYASELRQYLARRYSQLNVVTFRRLVFDGVQEETVLLLAVRQDSQSAHMSFLELDDLRDLHPHAVTAAGPTVVDVDHARDKWTQFYLSPAELDLIRTLEESHDFIKLGSLAEVDVGIVTGRNEFFVLTPQEAKQRKLQRWCVPLVGRSAQIPGLILLPADWQCLVANNGKCLLLRLGDIDAAELPEAAQAYLKYGEQEGFHQGYKCRVRLPRWWNVPSVWVPDAFLLRQIYDGPRIVQNRAGATCTDTIHRIRTATGTDTGWLAAASINSLTFAFAEIYGRSYGGGVLELEPTEAERLPFPRPSPQLLPVDAFDAWARRRKIEQVLEEVDRLLLRVAGLSASDVKTLRGIWRKLCERRKSRKRR